MAGYSYSIKGGPASAYPPREFMEQQQHQHQQYQQHQQHQQHQQQQQHQQYQHYQQFQQYRQDYRQQQQQHLQYRDAAPPPSSQYLPPRNPKRGSARPASSIYSQPSPVNTNFQIQQQQPQRYEYQEPRHHNYPQGLHRRNTDGVSPESSPELSAAVLETHDRPLKPPNISPVEREQPQFTMTATQAAPQADSTHDGRPPSASRSNIPMKRRERRQNQDAAARTLRETKSKERLNQMQERTSSIASSTRGYKGGEVRWDPQTGELTSSQKGRPSQVKPAEYARGLGISGNDPASPTEPPAKEATAPASTGIASFASRLRRTVQGVASGGPPQPTAHPPQPIQQPALPKSPDPPVAAVSSLPVPVAPVAPIAAQPRDFSASTDPAAGAFTSNRPAWHGASGRTTLVAPVHDTPDVAPLNIPRKSSKRVGSMSKLTDGAGTANPNILSSPPRQNNLSIASPPVSPPPLGDETQGQATVRQGAASGQLSALTPAPQTTRKPLASPTSSATQSYPSPPMSADPTYKESLASQQQQQQHQQQQAQTSRIRRKPTPSHQNLASYDESDPFNYNNRPNPSFASSPVSPRPPAQDAEWAQPPSRFSITTYNSTPRESLAEFDPRDAPEMPPIPDPLRSSPPYQYSQRPQARVESGPVQQPSPPRHKPTPIVTKPLPGIAGEENVMDRRRPPRMGHASPNSIKNGNEPIVISLKTPWMSGNHTPLRDSADGSDYLSNSSGGEDNGIPDASIYSQLRNKNLMGVSGGARGGDASDRMSMAGSIHKNLPPAPPETTAKDRVAMLNAQLAGLAQRRVNTDRSIKQMTELMPTDNLLATPDVLYKREMEKRKVERLRSDLAEIQREEYEIGLKLHRAYKRLDKNAEYEPTTLWVRRVTG